MVTEPTQLELDRKAELTLLSVCLHKEGADLQAILDKFGVDFDEFKYLCNKWKHVLNAYSKEFQNGNIDAITGNLKDLS